MTAPSEDATPARRSWRDALAIYLQPRVIGMGFLGFSSGLPFLTLSRLPFLAIVVVGCQS